MLTVYHNDTGGPETAAGPEFRLKATAEILFISTVGGTSIALQMFDEIADAWRTFATAEATFAEDGEAVLLLPGQTRLRFNATAAADGDNVIADVVDPELLELI